MNGISLKDVPNAIWYCVTIAFTAVVIGFVVMSINGTDATEFRSFINTIMNAGGLILGGSGALAAGVAAKNSKDTKEQTNGALDKRIATQVATQLVQHGMIHNDNRVVEGDSDGG